MNNNPEYTSLAFRLNRPLQARELDEMQANAAAALRGVADVLFAEGDIAAGAACAVDDDGTCTMDAGSIYMAGMVRTVPAASFAIPMVGEVSIGVYLLQELVTALQDPDLYDNELESPTRGEAGADRIKTTLTWGVRGDGTPGNYYPVHTVVDGVVRPREPAPQLKVMSDAIARYDRDSTGGLYVVRGLISAMLEDGEDGAQRFTVSAGAARVGGWAVELPTARRVVHNAVPNTMQINSEPHASAGAGLQRVAFDRWPVLKPATVRVQRRRVVQITHSPIAGAADPLPDNSVVKINSVKQGATAYAKDVDYKLTASQVDWSLPGAEIAPGSQYEVDYEYMSTEQAQDQTARDFAIEGAVQNSVMYLDYEFALQRIDVIAMDAKGDMGVITGVPAVWQPVKPAVPPGLLGLAAIVQTWDERRRVRVDQVRTMTMQMQWADRDRMDRIELDLAELRLATDVSGRFGGLKKGYFADPMQGNSMRDQGREQTAMIAGGALQLYEAAEGYTLGDGTTTYRIDYTLAKSLVQSASSGTLTITPPAPVPPVQQLPASVTLTPAIDRWQYTTTLNYPRTVEVLVGIDGSKDFADQVDETGSHLDATLLNTSGITMREIELLFTLQGFKPGELLAALAFDGQTVAFNPQAGGTVAADAQGVIKGRFTIPPKLPVGTKSVVFSGSQGSSGNATFVGQVELQVNVNRVQRVGTSAIVGSRIVTYVI